MIFTEKDFTKTVYSIGWSETIKTLNEYRQKDNSFLFDETWTKKQDNLHQEYLSLWKKSQEANISSIEDLNFGYPTNGASEAIFMQLTHLNSKGKRLVVFKEEYEGYSMFAKNINMPLFFVDRDNVEWSLINRRKKLRALINSDNLGADEATIIEYNIPRCKWIEKWKPHYLNIDRLLMSLKSGKMNSEEYLNAMFGNCDEFYRPFFPK